MFLFYPVSYGLPVGTPFTGRSFLLDLPRSVAAPYRQPLFIINADDGQGGATSNQPQTTPAQQRRAYKAKLENLGTARGTITDVAPLGPLYDYSPFDLVIANSAFGIAVPPEILNVSNAPLYPNNDPTVVYGPDAPPYAQGEAGALAYEVALEAVLCYSSPQLC